MRSSFGSSPLLSSWSQCDSCDDDADVVQLPFEEGFWTTRSSDGLTPLCTPHTPNAEFARQASEGGNSILGSALTLTSTCIGTGLLALPFAFATAGLVPGLLMLVLFAAWSSFSSRLLVECCTWVGCYSYEEIMLAAFGQGGGVLMELTVIWLLVGAMTSLLVVAGDGLMFFFKYMLAGSLEHVWWHNRLFLTACNVCVVALPLSWSQSTRSLSFTNSIAVSCTIVVGMLLMLQGSSNGSNLTQLAECVRAPIGLNTLRAVPIIMLSLGCQVQVPCVYGELQDRSVPRMGKAIVTSSILCFVMYCFVAVFGLIAAQRGCDDVPGNILEGLESQGVVVTTMRVLMAISVTLVYPMLCLPCRSVIDHLVCAGGGAARIRSPAAACRHGVETCIIICVTLFLASMDSDLASVFGLTGATAGTLICYVLPPTCYLSLRLGKNHAVKASTAGRAVLCYVIIVSTAPLAVFVTWQEGQH